MFQISITAITAKDT